MKTNLELKREVRNTIKRKPLLNTSEIRDTVQDRVVSLTGVVDSYVKKLEADIPISSLHPNLMNNLKSFSRYFESLNKSSNQSNSIT